MYIDNRRELPNETITDRLFNRTLTECHTGIDTCTWLLEPEDRQEMFFKNLETAQKETNCTVWTTQETIAEIQSKLNDPKLSPTANRAIAYLHKMEREHRIIIYQQSSQHCDRRPFADPVFLARLLENRDASVALITQDRALACDVMQLNDFQSVRGCRIMVYRVNGAGRLTRFALLKNGEGKYVDPRTTGLYVSQGTPASSADNTPAPKPELNPGDMVWGERGITLTLGEELSQGAESSVFVVAGSPDLLVKVFNQPSQRKTEKCKLLRESKFPCAEAVLPLELIYDQHGSFRGYTMKCINGVEVSRLFTQNGRTKYASSWNRQHYALLAQKLAQTIFDFSQGGLLVADISPSNFLVGYNESGVLDPNKVFAIDLDSAQFGSERLGCIYPPDGITPDYAAPEFLRGGIDDQQLRNQASVIYSASLLCLQCCMCGVHPFRKCMENGRMATVAQAIAQGAFPYSSGNDFRQATAPSGADKLWSNMSADAKQFFYHLFQQGGQYNAVDKRPGLLMLVKTMHSYVSWIGRVDNQQRYPEILSLEPAQLKPFYARCSHPDCPHPQTEFIVSSYRSDGRYYCPECLDKIRSQRAVTQTSAPRSTAPHATTFIQQSRLSTTHHISNPMPTAAIAQAAIPVQTPNVSNQPASNQHDNFVTRFSNGVRRVRSWLVS